MGLTAMAVSPITCVIEERQAPPDCSPSQDGLEDSVETLGHG